ncbi:heat shock factor 2-binding protein-like [Ctenocephalides felis]|uniref:heat shock factor 2-binding protein-like n=1 Tax=Ctenocephalides felis TaxID=7515 RepID=UPI000E6E1AE9|nr:heat shock factor 2-binding protein-like [Ctenocephalides felis]
MTDDLSCLQARIENLQDEWQAQQEHMGRMQAEMYKLRRQLSHQSSFCASLGAVLGQLVWKASQVAIVVEKMLAGFQNKVGDFFCIVEGTLASFLETYKGSMPGPESDERQFLLSMCGVITNIAAVPQGREFLCASPNGLTLIQAILKAIPAVPLPSGRELKRYLFHMLNCFLNIELHRDNSV